MILDLKSWLPSLMTPYGSDFPFIRPPRNLSFPTRSCASRKWIRRIPYNKNTRHINILFMYMYVCMCMWSVQVCHLWHGEAESGNLCIIYKRNSDFVWQHENTVYDILNNAVTQTTVKDRENERSVMMLNIRTNQSNALNSIYPPISNFFPKNMWYFEWQDYEFTSCIDHFYYSF